MPQSMFNRPLLAKQGGDYKKEALTVGEKWPPHKIKI